MRENTVSAVRLRKSCTVLFLIFVVIGILFEFVVYLQQDPVSVEIVTAVNCALVAFYALSIFSRIKSLSIRLKDGGSTVRSFTPKWADSVYYLGFILTLTALIFAFAAKEYEFSDRGSVLGLTQSAIALSSTVAALIIRTIWLYSIDPEGENEESDPEHLDKEIQSLRLNIERLNQSCSDLSTELGKLREEARDASMRGTLVEREALSRLMASLQSLEVALRKYTIIGALVRAIRGRDQ